MIHIGIDPDITANGVAVWDSNLKEFILIENMDFWQVIEEFESWLIPINVIIEAGWLNKKSNWHGKKSQSKAVGEKIAKNVGANHQVGILLYEYCLKKGISVRLVRPIKMRKKVNADYFKNLTGYEKQTNQDKRDAGMLVYGL